MHGQNLRFRSQGNNLAKSDNAEPDKSLGMINFELTEEEKQALYYERFHHPHPRVQKKMEALWLKSQKLPHASICQLAGISGRHKKAERIGSDELEGFGIGPKIWWTVIGNSSRGGKK